MKRIYKKPVVSVVSMGNDVGLLAGSNNDTGYKLGGGSNGSDNEEKDRMGSGGSDDFDGGLGAKRHNSWRSWDDWE